MAYNNIFPATYQNPYYQQPVNYQQPQIQQPSQPQSQAPTSQNSPMIWVQGETGAKSYLLAPNTTLPLWDSENQTIYLKSTDASGMPSMKILDYTIRDNTPPQVQAVNPQSESKPDYVTHAELMDFESMITNKIEEIKEGVYESYANDANGGTAKKQSGSNSRTVRHTPKHDE